MSFEYQETTYTCGPAALRYALSSLGIGLRGTEETGEADIRALIGKPWLSAATGGYDETELARAARKLGLNARARAWKNSPDACVDALRTSTAKGRVCVVSVHDDAPHFHWMCVPGFETPDRAIVLDPSAFDADHDTRTYRLLSPADDCVPALMAVSRLRNWVTPTEAGDGQFFLELWPDSDRFPSSFRWHDGLTRLMSQHEHFALYYDEYVDEARGVFSARQGPSAADFLDAVRAGVVADAQNWIALPKAAALKFLNLELDSWTAIARAYSLRVETGNETRALGNLTGLLGWRAAEFMYDAGRYD